MVQLLAQRFCLGVHLGDATGVLHCNAGQPDHPGVIGVAVVGTGQRVAGLLRQHAQVIHGLQTLRPGGQFRVLAGLWVNAFDLAEAEGEQVRLPGPLAGVLHALVELLVDAAPQLEQFAVALQHLRHGLAAEAVKHLALTLLGAQSDLFQLAMDGGQLPHHAGDGAKGCGDTSQPGPRSTIGT